MHEYHLLQQLMDRAGQRTARSGASRVVSVTLKTGIGVSPEAVRQSFEALSFGTPFEESQLCLEPARVALQCPACGRAEEVPSDVLREPLWACSACGTLVPVPSMPDLELTELLVE